VAIVAARMEGQTLAISVIAGAQRMQMQAKEHRYLFDLAFLNGIVALSVDKAAREKSNDLGTSWIIDKYDQAQKSMNECVWGVQRFLLELGATTTEDYAESADSLDLALFPQVLSGGPNHVNTMHMF
jgi:hypothetical protein